MGAVIGTSAMLFSVLNTGLLRRLALARICLGIAALVAPAASPRPFVGRSEAGRPWTKLLARVAGGWGVAVGVALLRGLDRGGGGGVAVRLGGGGGAGGGGSATAGRGLARRM